MQKEQQVLVKILSVGDPEVGKSCLIKRYCEGRFIGKYISTIGVDYGVKKMIINSRKVAINFFDLSGDEDFKDIRNAFFRDAQGVLLVCSLTKRSSFQNLQQWESTMKQNGLDPKQAVVFVVANKADEKGRQVQAEQVKGFASKRGYQFKQVSASSGQGVNQLFDALFNKCVAKIEDAKKMISK